MGIFAIESKTNDMIAKAKANVLIPLFLVIFIDAFGMTLVMPLMAPLFSSPDEGILAWNISLAMKDFLYGLTVAIYAVFMFFASPLLGDFSDQIGRKKILLLCLYGEGIGMLVAGIAVVIHSFILFFISRIITGTMAGSLPIAQAAITDISDEHNKTINISLIGFAFTLGFIVGPIIGGFLTNKHLISWFSVSTPFFVTTILAFCNAMGLSFTFKETSIKPHRDIDKKIVRLIKPLIMFANAFRDKAIRNITLTCFFYILGWNAYTFFVLLYLCQKYHFSSIHLGYFMSWIAFAMSFAMLVIIRIMVRYFQTIQILWFSLLISVVGVFIAMINGVAMQWISVIPIGCGVGLTYASILTLFSNAISSDLQGWIMGVATATMAAAGAFSGLLVGAVSTSATLSFLSINIMWILALLFSLRINNKPQ